MAGQPMIARPWPHLAPCLAAVALSGCAADELFIGIMDTPKPMAALPADAAGPFDTPIGFVADGRRGLIRPLDLLAGRFVATDSVASFLRGDAIATGAARLLSSLAAVAPTDDTVVVFATDNTQEQLLRLPWISGVTSDGRPIPVSTTHADPVFTDADGSGDSAALDDLTVLSGRAATETWTLTFDGEDWTVEGSASGTMRATASFDTAYESDLGALSFTITGSATAGDTITLDVDSGAEAFDLPGTPIGLAMAPDGSRLAVTWQARDGATAGLTWYDLATNALGATAALPADARPGSMAWAADSSALFVADNGRSAAWEIVPGAPDTLTEHVLPWSLTDVAPLTGDGFRHLYVAPAEGHAVWLYDLDANALIDINAATAAVDGLDFEGPVQGLEALSQPYDWQEIDLAGDPLNGQTVAVALASGRVVFMEEQTGCLLQDDDGPRTLSLGTTDALGDYDTNYTLNPSAPTTAFLQPTFDTRNHVTVNPCAGIAPAETWTLHFDGIDQVWDVEASVSGDQGARVIEDDRYLSDNAEVSFIVRAGAEPSVEGWEITFTVLEGSVSANGDLDADGIRDIELDLPGDPVFYWEDTDDGLRAYVAVPVPAADLVVGVDAQTGLVAATWE